jgi:hypothetical protein
MAKARTKSATENGENSGTLASQRPFLFEPSQEQQYAVAEQSQNLPIRNKRNARSSKSSPAHASDSLSLFPYEVLASSSKPSQIEADAAEPHNSRIFAARITASSEKKQRISGLQEITTAVETASCSGFAVWSELEKHAYQHIEMNEAGEPVEYRLSQLGRAQLKRLTGRDTKTIRRALSDLQRRHLIGLHVPADAYTHRSAIYKLIDPKVATQKLKTEDGFNAWQQKGRGRVLR